MFSYFARVTTLVLSVSFFNLSDNPSNRICPTAAAKVILFLSFLIIRGLLSCAEKDYKDIQCRMLQDGKVQNQRVACRHQGPLLQLFFLLAQLEYLFEPDKISVRTALISILYLYPVTALFIWNAQG